MWSSRGDTAAFYFQAMPGLDRPANQVYAGDYRAFFDQNRPPDTDKLGGKRLASGEKVILGARGMLMGGDQITCGVQDVVVACVLARAFRHNQVTTPPNGTASYLTHIAAGRFSTSRFCGDVGSAH